MITDEKHCEIAKELRSQASAWRYLLPDIRMSDRQFTDRIHVSFGLKDMDMPVHEALDMLADLIDRPTCTILCECDAYSSLGERIDGMRLYDLSCGHQAVGFEKPRYCPKCGSVITDAKR